MRLFRRMSYLFRKREGDADLARELEFHRQMLEQEQHGSNRRMGNVTLAAEDARAVWLPFFIESFLQDVCYAARNLVRQPGFTIPALLALTLGIGLNTSFFTAFNAIALRPWPVLQPWRVVTLLKELTVAPGPGYAGFSVAEYRYLREHTRTFTGLLFMRSEQVRLGDQTPRAVCNFVSGDYFSVLGVAMERGRGFIAAESATEKPQAVAVLSYQYWQARYAGDPGIIGRQIHIDDVPFTVVGVTAEEFTGTSSDRNVLWVPLGALTLARPTDPFVKALLFDPKFCCSEMAGRLAPGVSRKEAQAELTALLGRISNKSDTKPPRIVAAGTSFLERPNKKSKVVPMFALMMAAVALVLLLACANVSNLLLARGAARQREIAARLSLGAARSRLVRQLLTESLILAAAGSALGLLLATQLPALVMKYMAEDTAPLFRLQPDRTVLFYSLAVCVCSAIVFGLAPALRSTRVSVSEVLKQQSAFASPRFPLRGVLLGAQVAIGFSLLIAAGLMLRGVQQARATDVGFTVQNILLMSVDLPVNRYNDARAQAFTAQLMERLRPLADVALCKLAPLGNTRTMATMALPGQTRSRPATVLIQAVSPEYFAVLQIPFLSGRNLVQQDTARGNIVINETLARRYFPDESAVGKAIVAGGQRREIAGVVRDAQLSGIGPVEPTFFVPYFGGARSTIVLSGRAIAKQLPAIVAQVEPRAILNVVPMPEQLERWLGSSRSASMMATWLGLLALALASIGVFGVLAYSVEQRRREIGVRMAVGARPAEIIWMILRVNLRPILGGLAVGVCGSLIFSRLLHSFLYGISPLDPLAYGGVAVLLLACGLAASIVPARRATHIDPLIALRYE